MSHRSFLNTTLEGYWQIGPDGRTVEVNRALCRMLGYTEKEILSLEMVMRYAHARDKQVDAALDRLDQRKSKTEQTALSQWRRS